MRAEIDGVSFEMAAPFDFSFLSNYGRVFTVFDDQDSGNICFGVKNSAERLFIKFSGAPTMRAGCPPGEAMARARRTAEVYRALRHESLLNMLSCEEIGGGVAQLFPWVDAICWGRMYPEQHAQFCALPVAERLMVFDTVLRFHRHVLSRGYVPVDFYDGSVLYDTAAKKTYICDIEFYQKQPCVNQMGRMWGSSRFMSPEEFTRGAPIDELTCVFGMGATALTLFGAGKDGGYDGWQLSEPLYKTARRAVREERSERWPSLAEFTDAWRKAQTETI